MPKVILLIKFLESNLGISLVHELNPATQLLVELLFQEKAITKMMVYSLADLLHMKGYTDIHNLHLDLKVY